MDNEHAAAYGPSCADCGSGGCADGSGAYPPFCATAALAAEDRAALLEQYRDEDEPKQTQEVIVPPAQEPYGPGIVPPEEI